MRSPALPKVPGALAAAFTSAILIAQQVAGKAARDALFLSSFRVKQLPLAMAAGAVLSLLAVVALARVMTRSSPARVMPGLFALSACGFAVDWLVGRGAPRAGALLVYLQTALLAPVMISTFWSLINERFDPHSAKRAIARVAGGGTLGGVLGGVAVWRASTLVEPASVLLLLTGLSIAGLAGILFVAPRASQERASIAPLAHGERSAFGELRKAPFLRNLALLVAVGASTSALLDYMLGTQAVASYGKGQPLLEFFSLFWLGVGVASFVLQISLGRVALEKLGIAVGIAILPGIVILGGAVGLAVPGLVSAALLRGSEAVQRNTLFRAAYEQLYTPVAEERKRVTKALIDVGFDRLGTVAGSGLAVLVIAVAPPPAVAAILLAFIVVFGLLTLPIVLRIHVGYVEALHEGLRDRARRLEQAESPDSPDNGPHSVHLEREMLIESVEALRPGGLQALLSSSGRPELDAAPPTDGLVAATLRECRAALADSEELLSGDRPRVESALGRLSALGPSTSCAILLLGDSAFHEAAVQALRAVVDTSTGQLLDALLNPATDFVVRRRIPRVLSASRTQRAADGLLLAVTDSRFEVRYECGRALLKVTDGNSDVVIERSKVIEAIRWELEVDRRALDKKCTDFDDEHHHSDDVHTLVDALIRDRVDRGLEHVFSILALHLDREPLRTAFRALHHEDNRYRGTALEYLDNVLPKELHHAVWPLLGEEAPLPTARSPHELLAELTQAAHPSLVVP